MSTYKNYRITRGSFVGTADDSSNGFYVDDADSPVLDRRGAGFQTVEDAKNRIDEIEFSKNEQNAMEDN